MKASTSIFTFIGFLIGKSFAFYCYGCNNNITYPRNAPQDICSEKKQPSQLLNITCPELSTEEKDAGAIHACYKLEKSMFYFVNETFMYDRGCTTIYGKADFCAAKHALDPEQRCYLCTQNTCNEANDMQIIRALMFFLAIFIVLYMKDLKERNHLRDSKPFRSCPSQSSLGFLKESKSEDMKLVAIFLIIVAFVIAENRALLCYSCKQQPAENCAAKTDPPNVAAVNCPSTPREEFINGSRATCYKVEKSVKLERGNETFIYQRGCTISGGFKDFCDEVYQNDPETKCYLCHNDYCNAGIFMKGWKFLLVIVLASLFLNNQRKF